MKSGAKQLNQMVSGLKSTAEDVKSCRPRQSRAIGGRERWCRQMCFLFCCTAASCEVGFKMQAVISSIYHSECCFLHLLNFSIINTTLYPKFIFNFSIMFFFYNNYIILVGIASLVVPLVY